MKKRVVRAEEFEVVDAAGNVRLRIGLSNDESPFFSMLDPAGQVRAEVKVESEALAGAHRADADLRALEAAVVDHEVVSRAVDDETEVKVADLFMHFVFDSQSQRRPWGHRSDGLTFGIHEAGLGDSDR